MPSKHPTEPPPDTRVEAAATELTEVAASITKAYLKAAIIVREMEKYGRPWELRTLLVSRAGLAPDDAETLLKLARIPEKHKAIRDSNLSPAGIAALVGARDEIRAQAFHLLERGQRISANDIVQLEARNDVNKLSDAARSLIDRMSLLRSMATENAPELIFPFQKRVDRLAGLVRQFVQDFVESDPEDPNPFRTDDDRYLWTHEEVSRAAASTLREFERLFGKGAGAKAKTGTEAMKLWWAEKALRRLAAGRFAHVDGMSFRENDAGHAGPGLLDALGYLGTPAHVDDQDDRPRRSHLRVLELRAGGGGMAIGLMAAGFAHAALYESVLKRAKTLRHNWPDWKVRRLNLHKVPESEFEQYRDVDLVAGSPFIRKGPNKSLFGEMTTAVRVIKPRAFVFEAAIKLKQKSRELTLAAAQSALSDLGYRVSRHVINCRNFGLPQDRERMLIVGLRNDEPGVFEAPHLEKPILRSVSQVLGPAMIRHLTPEHEKPGIAKDSNQDVYNRWAGRWLHLHQHHVLPTIVSQDGEGRDEWVRSWKDKGFRITKVRKAPPSVDEVKSIDFVPEITFEALALAQGYPADWKFLAEGEGIVSMIGESLPPVVAKAVGLSLRTFLTGERFDLRKSLLEPVIEAERIGKGRKRLRKKDRFPWEMARRVLEGEPIKDVETNHMRRKIVQYAIADLESYRAREDEIDLEWEKRLFPDGHPD